jgi:leader peptidase (prepilin peptidase)/N-methyltransferase
MIPYLNEVFIFLMGLCIGSFLNVCIYRLPAAKSIVHPRSMCPNCDTLIPFYDNIPVFSYLWLKGQCRHCEIKISMRYPIVELLGGLFALAAYLKFGLEVQTLIYYLFMAALLAVTFIDIDHRIIPDVITLPGIPIGFAASFALPAITYKDSLLGILIGGGSLFLVAWLYTLLTKKEGMGGGDIKLLAMMGAIVGWQGVLFTIFVVCCLIGGNPGRICGHAPISQRYETGSAFWTVSVHRRYPAYFLRPPAHIAITRPACYFILPNDSNFIRGLTIRS